MLLLIGLLCPAAQAAGQPDPLGVTQPHAAPSHGVVAFGSDGSYTYTPATGYAGPDTFTYTITDGSGATSSAVVTITVTSATAEETTTIV